MFVRDGASTLFNIFRLNQCFSPHFNCCVESATCLQYLDNIFMQIEVTALVTNLLMQMDLEIAKRLRVKMVMKHRIRYVTSM